MEVEEGGRRRGGVGGGEEERRRGGVLSPVLPPYPPQTFDMLHKGCLAYSVVHIVQPAFTSPSDSESGAGCGVVR